MRRTLLPLLLTVSIVGGCKDLTLPAGLPCGPGATCPDGQTCSTDGFCLQEEDGPGVDGSVSIDAAPPDAEEPPPPSMFITVGNEGGPRSDYDVLLSVDTARLISAGLLDSKCDNMHFVADEVGELSFWIETGCNTSTTQIWLGFDSLAEGDTTVHWTYGAEAAATSGISYSTHDQLSWNGTLIAPRMGACSGDSVAFTPLDAVFPRGSATYTGEPQNGAHTHALDGFTAYSSNGQCDATGGGLKYGGSHRHALGDITSQSAVVQVSSIEVVYCAHSSVGSLDWLPDDREVILLDEEQAGWTHVDAFTDRFPRGAVVFGLTVDSAPHQHTISGSTGGGQGASNYDGGGTCESGTGAAGHNHPVNLTSGAAEPLPPYLDLLFAARADVGPLPPGAILLAQSAENLPPMGWARYDALDGRYPRGAATPGGTGGSTTHSHGFSGSTGAASAGNCYNGGSNGALCDPHNHSHSVSGTSLAGASDPPHLDIVFVQRAIDDTTKSFAPGP